MSGKIIITSSWDNPHVREALSDFALAGPEAGVTLEVRRTRALGVVEFGIAVLGGVSGYFIGKLIEAAYQRIVGTREGAVDFYVLDKKTGLVFQLPGQRDQCVAHFQQTSVAVEIQTGKVFVSHSSRDRQLVESYVVGPLAERGIPYWYSTEHIQTADEWERKILAGLRSCEWLLVALSPNAVESDWVRAEVHWGIKYRRHRVVPALFQDCAAEELHLMLIQIQHVDFRSDPAAGQARLLEFWSRDKGPSPPAPP